MFKSIRKHAQQSIWLWMAVEIAALGIILLLMYLCLSGQVPNNLHVASTSGDGYPPPAGRGIVHAAYHHPSEEGSIAARPTQGPGAWEVCGPGQLVLGCIRAHEPAVSYVGSSIASWDRLTSSAARSTKPGNLSRSATRPARLVSLVSRAAALEAERSYRPLASVTAACQFAGVSVLMDVAPFGVSLCMNSFLFTFPTAEVARQLHIGGFLFVHGVKFLDYRVIPAQVFIDQSPDQLGFAGRMSSAAVIAARFVHHGSTLLLVWTRPVPPPICPSISQRYPSCQPLDVQRSIQKICMYRYAYMVARGPVPITPEPIPDTSHIFISERSTV